MPERFDLEYNDADNKPKRPIMLHRVVYGALERFIGILLEHTNGNLPTWLSPVQCRVISFTDRNIKVCQKAIKEIAEKIPQIRIDADFRDLTVNNKIREAEIQRIPYIIVMGDKEEKSGSFAVRKDGKIKIIKPLSFIEELKKEIEARK
jgi:threonyl-tRNA synthetase